MENREAHKTPSRATPESHIPPSPAIPYPVLDIPTYQQNPSVYWDRLFADLDRLNLVHSLGGTDSVAGTRVQSGNLYGSREFGSTYDEPVRYSNLMSGQNRFTGHESVGSSDSVLAHRVRSAALGQNSNLYSLREYGYTPDVCSLYSNQMSNPIRFSGRPESIYSSNNRFNMQNSNFRHSFNSQEFGYANPMSNLTGRSHTLYDTNSRVDGSSSWPNPNQNGLFDPEPVYLTSVPTQAHFSPRHPSLGRTRPMQHDGLGRAGPAYPGRSIRSNGGPGRDYSGLKLSDFRGSIKDMAERRVCWGILRDKMEEGDEEDTELIYEEIKDGVAGLMMNYCGSNVVQKLFKVCKEEQIDYMLSLVLGDKYQFLQICYDNYGSVAMVKLLEKATRGDQQTMVISALSDDVVRLSKDQNGYKVVQHCVTHFENIDAIFDEITTDCYEIAAHRSGCCVLQDCLDRATHVTMNRLICEIGPSMVTLSEHPYGNYVVQYLLGKKIPSVTGNILHRLSGNYVSLSTNKCGSNVVEKCITCASKDEAAEIINEIMISQSFLTVLQDSFGNYVVQKALEVSQNMKEIQMKLEKCILDLQTFLQSHPFGNRVLSKVKHRRF